MQRKIQLREISDTICINFFGKDKVIDGLNLCNRKTQFESILSYVTSDKYLKIVAENVSIVCLLLKEEDLEKYKSVIDRDISFIVSETPEKIFYELHHYLYNKTDFYDHFTFKSIVGQKCRIHSEAFIDDGVVIGDSVTVGAKSIVHRGSRICNNTTIGCSTIIGSEGFQIIRVNGVPLNIKHVGGTYIGENVYVGDNTTVCNSLFEGSTVIGENVKIDNLVHIAHNCHIGSNAVVTAGTILCGSSILKKCSWIGVNSSVLNGVTVGENAFVGIGSVVTRDVADNKLVYGVPAKEKSEA